MLKWTPSLISVSDFSIPFEKCTVSHVCTPYNKASAKGEIKIEEFISGFFNILLGINFFYDYNESKSKIIYYKILHFSMKAKKQNKIYAIITQILVESSKKIHKILGIIYSALNVTNMDQINQ